ncbi:hypothetical protein N9Z64_01630 [bacterium]|nr:hypothetical protein [bacterium]
MQWIVIPCEQRKIGHVLSSDFTFITHPMITNLQVFEKQSLDLRRFFGGYFQDFLDVEEITEWETDRSSPLASPSYTSTAKQQCFFATEIGITSFAGYNHGGILRPRTGV